MILRPLAGFFVEPLDVGLELGLVDAPDPTAADLYRRQFAGADQSVGLGNTDRQVCGNVFERVKARRDGRTRFIARRLAHGTQSSTEKAQLPGFVSVCSRLPDTNRDWGWTG